MMNVELFIYAA